ncbi:DNA mismatch repair protein Mlh3 [Papilio machaon]|uniref:DNA mismatch repair protein Mlh3 n=1 Tax=Papilio machaon TaxID=76193 RepID=A0A194QSS7_PAPMA|nr:DNA mismatch repair protein Mlh3 [Papilio machaon]
MIIKKLPTEIQSLLSASSKINNYKNAVEELVYNSLDADATSVAVRIHIYENVIQVIDNGFGIAKCDIPLLGQRYASSKVTEKSAIKSAPIKFGFRGESLSNIIEVSQCVKITTRHKDADETWVKSFYNGQHKDSKITSMRPSKGTTNNFLDLGNKMQNNEIPSYFIFITCPYLDYDVNITSTKTIIEFKDWTQIRELLEKLVQFYKGDIKLKKLDVAQTERKNKIENTREEVRKIIEKVLGNKSKGHKISQLRKGVKGKIVKKKKNPNSSSIKRFKNLHKMVNKSKETGHNLNVPENLSSVIEAPISMNFQELGKNAQTDNDHNLKKLIKINKEKQKTKSKLKIEQLIQQNEKRNKVDTHTNKLEFEEAGHINKSKENFTSGIEDTTNDNFLHITRNKMTPLKNKAFKRKKNRRKIVTQEIDPIMKQYLQETACQIYSEKLTKKKNNMNEVRLNTLHVSDTKMDTSLLQSEGNIHSFYEHKLAFNGVTPLNKLDKEYLKSRMSPIFENCNNKNICSYNLEKDYFQDELYNNFANDVLDNIKIYENKVSNMNEVPKKINKDPNCLKFDTQSLKNAKVFGQVDRKFIVAELKSDNLNMKHLVLFDQHAVHERIRLEENLSDYKDVDQWNSVNCEKISIKLSKDHVLYLNNFKDKFQQLGLDWKIENDSLITINAVPKAIFGKYCRQADVIMQSIKNLIIEETKAIKTQGGNTLTYPKSIMDLVFSEACRYAIKFGDKLSKRECATLISSLSSCRIPFQCAHGRPVLAVLLDLKTYDNEYKVLFPKINAYKEFVESFTCL